MKAYSIKQPYTNRILHGNKTIELSYWQTKYRGDLLICSRQAPADFIKKFPFTDSAGRNKVEDLDNGTEEYMFFGKALFVVELYDLKPMDDEEEMAAYGLYSESLFLWHFRNVRPIIPFNVNSKRGLFEVDKPIVYQEREQILQMA